jgi:periplasmic protein TonB
MSSWRASIACPGFIRLSTLSRRSRSIAANSRTSRFRAFHFAYLVEAMPSASSAEMIQTVISVDVTRSIKSKMVHYRCPFRTKFKVNARPGKSVCRHNLTFGARGGKFHQMRAGRGASAAISVVGVLIATHVVRGQEATSANLPDQFQTGEMIEVQKPKTKKVHPRSKAVATTPKQQIAPVPEQAAAAEHAPIQTAPAEEKRAELVRSAASIPADEKPATPVATSSPEEEPAVVPVPTAKKLRPRERSRPALQPEAPSISAPVPMSLSVAQSMAITAPLPDYPYEARRRNLSGSGICIITVDTATGTVTDATMSQTTGSPLLDKLTTQTFKSWRFKPGTVSQVRVPISYE